MHRIDVFHVKIRKVPMVSNFTRRSDIETAPDHDVDLAARQKTPVAGGHPLYLKAKSLVEVLCRRVKIPNSQHEGKWP
jgi:hypothetical protein